MKILVCFLCNTIWKRKQESKYVTCDRCHRPVCKSCSIVRVERERGYVSGTFKEIEKDYCHYCVAEEVLST